ncbi:MAG: aminopeptidase [Oscillospiraceae bacterium]|nr:aminopeptidase [Oscillospiraceae bacterium]
MTNNRISKFAKLLIKVGLNVQKGQPVVITCPVDCADFARLCAKEAYDAGCREVIMNWADDQMVRMKYLHAYDSIFDTVPQWRADMYNSLSAEGAAWLVIHSEDPESMNGVDPERLRRSSVASGKALKPYRDRQMVNFFPWCIASVPSLAWAKKVFPCISDEEAMDKLWNAILDASRVFEDTDPVKEWEEHCETLRRHVEIMNGYDFEYLEYKNSLGTDLTVKLPENHIWAGGSEETQVSKIPFCANIPTEEIFGAPLKTGVDGVVYASKPLVINGTIVDKFSFRLEKGKIVDVQAEVGLEMLKSAIAVDEGASYLGEVALVPYHSPISQSGLLFYNTLFDENAACHIAFGEGYACVKGGTEMTRDELTAAGINDSIMHEDFMVGTPDLSVIGVTKDGRRIPVMVDGDFAF